MKSMMVAVMAVIVGLSTGCAQIEYLQNPANYRVNELNGSRMYCHGDSRDNYTICAGWESPAQIAQKAEQAKIAEANARIAAENQAIADAKQAAIDKIANDKAAKLQAIADKKQAIADAKAAAFAASPAGKLKAKREAEAQAKRDAEAIQALFGGAIQQYNNMTPEERYQMERETAARRNAEFQQRSRESSARQQAQGDRNVFCHRNFGRSC